MSVWLKLGLAAWVASVATGAAALAAYQSQPGDAAPAPARWPEAIAHLARADDAALLVMTVHPHCPCSMASVRELARLAARAGDRLSVHVLFYRPPQTPDPWAEGRLWDAVAEIPGVARHVDANGELARRLGGLTSGHAVLYDRSGTLRFQGGITAGRGHEGDSPGRALVLAALDDIHSELGTDDHRGGPGTTQTYGCPLQGSSEASQAPATVSRNSP